jgi:hypothetical protein
MMQTAKRASGTIWLWPNGDEGELAITASPTVVCVWTNTAGANKAEEMIAGPFMPEPRLRTEQDLIDWYNQWLADGAPK